MSQPFSLFILPAPRSIKEAVKKLPFPIELCEGRYKELVFIFHDNTVQVLHGDKDIRDFSFVWLMSGWNSRPLAYAMDLYLDSAKTKHSPVEKSISKVSDTMVFALDHIPLPNTLFMSLSQVEKNFDIIQQVCGYPLIIKDVKGSQGKHSQYVVSQEELFCKIKELPRNRRFLFQSFIPNDYDWGVMVVNGVVVAGEKSYPSKGEFRNNACNGATENFIDVAEIPEVVKKMAVEATQAIGLAWARADIVIHQETGAAYLLEVNRYPGITAGSDEVNGAVAFLESQILPKS